MSRTSRAVSGSIGTAAAVVFKPRSVTASIDACDVPELRGWLLRCHLGIWANRTMQASKMTGGLNRIALDQLGNGFQTRVKPKLPKWISFRVANSVTP